MSLKQLENKTVWILGASSGIGKQLALLCAQSNARVLLTGPSFAGVERTLTQVQKINSSSGRIVSMDFNRPENIVEAVEHVIEKHGPIYLLIDNMSISGKESFLKLESDPFSEIIDRRVKSCAFMIKTILPSMVADGGGRIAFTGNVGGLYSGRGSIYNSVVQHAVEGLFRSIDGDHRRDKISLSIVIPVAIETEIGTGDSIRDSLVYKGQHDKKYLIMDGSRCARYYLKGVLRGQKKICINHKLRPLLILLRKFSPSLFDKITCLGFY